MVMALLVLVLVQVTLQGELLLTEASISGFRHAASLASWITLE